MTRIVLGILFINILFCQQNRVFGQVLSYQNDSMFINNVYVNETTPKSTFDSLFNSLGKIKVRKSEHRIDSTSNKKAKETTWYYRDKGIFIRKYSDNDNQISFGIKFVRDSDRKKDSLKKLKKEFVGKLYIGKDLITPGANHDELNRLKSSSLSIAKLNFGDYESILGGDLLYKQNIIRISFDSEKETLKSIFIHHNFKER